MADDPRLAAALAELADAREALRQERLEAEAFANMSHEMRTLLNGVVGITSLLLDTELGFDQRDYAKRIRSSGDALLHIINNVLDFAKTQAGKLEIDRVDFDLRRAVEDVGELLAERAQAKGIELVVAVHPAVPTGVRGDPTRLGQVLINLVSNAIKFTERGQVVVRVSLASETEDAVVVAFEVEDTGVGISPAGVERLFQAYTQVDRSAGGGYGGTGLGLALAKRLVEAMDGAIRVASVPGAGTTFSFTARLEKRAGAAERNVIPRIDLNGRRVLIVEDNPAARAVVHDMTTALGIECHGVADGAAALDVLRAAAVRGGAFDVALVDGVLPDMDGLLLARAVASEPAIASTRVVLLTYPGQASNVAGTRGVAALLAKPVRPSQLQACLMTLMGSPVETVRGAGRAPTLPRVAAEDARAARPKVLIVDDNVVNQKVGAFLVEKRGYGADVVGSGQEAVEAVLGRSYAAVLMDCQMPRFDGYAATALIRQREAAGVHTPIIALTANTGPGARERCMEAGMDDYLSKPIVAEALDQALRRWCPIPATRGPATVRGLRLGSDVRAAESIRPPEGPRETPRPAEVSGPSEAPRSSRYSTGRTPAPTVVQELARRSASPIDREAIAKLRQVQREGEPDVVAEVASLFLSDAPTRIASLRRAIDAADAPALERTAHALRGSAGHLGARGMQALCASLEEQARRGATVSASELVKALEEELERVRAALVREVTGGAEARIGRGSP